MKENTLTKNSLEVMEKLDGPLTITTYVNMLDEDYFRAMLATIMKTSNVSKNTFVSNQKSS